MTNFGKVFPEFPLTEEEFQIITNALNNKSNKELELIILYMASTHLMRMKQFNFHMSNEDRKILLQQLLGAR